MRRSSRSTHHLLAAAAIAAALVGCAHGSSAIPQSADAPAAQPYYSLAASSARTTALYEAHTVSFALDRIDQRDLPLDATYRHNGTGRGVTVYVFDGGISTDHPELAGRVRIGFTGFPDDPKICNAHGTAVAGAIAGSTLGVAPGANIVDVKMVQCEKLRGTIKAIVDGAHWVIADHAAHPGPAVANWSFIADTATTIPELDSAVSELRAAGIPVIVSAGNVNVDACHVSPGNAHGTIVVGASAIDVRPRATPANTRASTRMEDERAPDTAYGHCIDLYAPGDSVLLPSLDGQLRPITQLWNGTSMSAGYVSGAAALYLEAHPRATPDEVAAALEQNATPDVVGNARSASSRMLYVGPTEQLAQANPRVRPERH
jgi:subtilisin family serine protease